MGLNRNLGQLTEAMTESAGNVFLKPNNTVGGTNFYIGQTMATNDTWSIYGNTIALDRGELVFELGDNAGASSANGQRFRFFYNSNSSGTAKSPFILDYNDATFNTNASFTGNVGIGITSPDTALHIYGSSGWIKAETNSTGSARFQAKNSNQITDYGTDSTGGFIQTQGNYPLLIYTNQIERMRITSGGNVGIGTTSPSSKLDIASGDIKLTDTFKIGWKYDAGDSNMYSWIGNSYNGASADSGINYRAGMWTGGDVIAHNFFTWFGGVWNSRLIIRNSGTIGIGGGGDVNNAGIDRLSIGHFNGNYGWMQTWAGTSLYLNKNGNAVYAGTQRIDNNSDERIKENIEPINDALTTILSLNGRKFNMLDEDNILRYGFIAQEVEESLPDFVTHSDRSFEKGDIKVENLLTLESSGAAWASLLVEAIKEQQQQIKELQNEIILLKNK